MTCSAKHTKYQPTAEEWKCPRCGADNTKFWIDESPDGSEDCEALHEQDFAYCHNCEKGITGKAFAALIQKAKGLVRCECCKGTGLVAKVAP